MLLPNHGANPEQLLKALQIESNEELTDFSVNTNPFGPPKKILESWNDLQAYAFKYPDPTASLLKEKIAASHQIAPEQIIIGNGAAEIIFLLAQHFQKKKILIVEPTFSEYRDACSAFQCEIEQVMLDRYQDWQLEVEKIMPKMKEISAIFLCHPNNPTGCIYREEDLLQLFKEAKMQGVTVIVDEAFFDFCTSDISVVPHFEKYDNLVILRSLTKMYSIAGIRLGYAFAHEELISQLKRKQHPWNVNGIAQVIGATLFDLKSFANETAKKIEAERNYLFQQLRSLGYEVSPSVVNYYLLRESDKDTDLFPLMRYLIQHAIVPRHTYNFPSLDGKYLRLTIKEREKNEQLIKVLRGWKEQCLSL